MILLSGRKPCSPKAQMPLKKPRKPSPGGCPRRWSQLRPESSYGRLLASLLCSVFCFVLFWSSLSSSNPLHHQARSGPVGETPGVQLCLEQWWLVLLFGHEVQDAHWGHTMKTHPSELLDLPSSSTELLSESWWLQNSGKTKSEIPAPVSYDLRYSPRYSWMVSSTLKIMLHTYVALSHIISVCFVRSYEWQSRSYYCSFID